MTTIAPVLAHQEQEKRADEVMVGAALMARGLRPPQTVCTRMDDTVTCR